MEETSIGLTLVIPEGWRLVPKIPTAEMIQAMEDRQIEGASYIAENSIQYALWVEVWKAALIAAPNKK
jgi:hypothetical protein